jgi:O-antigen ligase
VSTIDHAGPQRALPAAYQTQAGLLTWPNALAAFVLLIWLVPSRVYRLPSSLPFNLELYRVAIALLVFVFVFSLFAGRSKLSAGGVGVPLALFAAFALASQFSNSAALDPRGGESNALNAFLYLMGFVVVLVLICSTLQDRAGVERVVKAFVLGGLVVAVAAIVASRTRYNVFDHLGNWIPFLEYDARYEVDTRGGVPRVRSSAQHPIALASALMLTVPLALYLFTRARTTARKAFWGIAALLILIGAIVPVARTAVVMAIVMLVLAVALRGRRVWRFWPALVIALAVLHLARPGVMGALYNSFFPENGLVSQVSGRAGLPGSGRLSDIQPGLELWRESPAFGIGRGNPLVGGRSPDEPEQGIIFDNQYLNLLVTLGTLGLLTLVWFLIATFVKLLRGARQRLGAVGDLVLVCALGVGGFAAAMYFFDAFSFVQVTMLFFAVAGLGLRALTLPPEPPEAGARPPA